MTFRSSLLGAMLVATISCAPQSESAARLTQTSESTPWLATWAAERQPRNFTASFIEQPNGTATWDRPVGSATPGSSLTNDAFEYENAEAGATCDGRATFSIEGPTVVLDASATAASDGTRGVALDAFIAGYSLCYRAPIGVSTVRFIANVALPAPMDATGATGNAGYMFSIGADRCFVGVGIDPMTHEATTFGNGRADCSADVPVGADGLACLDADEAPSLDVQANGAVTVGAAGGATIHARVTIRAEVPTVPGP